MVAPEDAATLAEMLQWDQVFDSWLALDQNLMRYGVESWVKNPFLVSVMFLPYVTAEEGCRSVMMGNGSRDISALKIEYEGDQKKVWHQKKTDEKDTQ